MVPTTDADTVTTRDFTVNAEGSSLARVAEIIKVAIMPEDFPQNILIIYQSVFQLIVQTSWGNNKSKFLTRCSGPAGYYGWTNQTMNAEQRTRG